MAAREDVRRLAMAHPGVIEVTSYSIGGQPVVWPYFERDKTRRKLTFREEVWAVRCPIPEKQMLIEAAPDIYFDDDYYRRYDVVLVRLDKISAEELAAMVERSYEIQSTKARKR